MIFRELENPAVKSTKQPNVQRFKKNDKEIEVLREGALSSQAQLTTFFRKRF